jgi:hypothetical protein
MPIYPGARLTEEQIIRPYSKRWGIGCRMGEGGCEPTTSVTFPGSHADVTRTYLLPESATPSTVFEYIRSHLPPGWTVVTEATCERIGNPNTGTFPATTAISGGPASAGDQQPYRIIRSASFLTVLAPGDDGSRRIGSNGVSFQLLRDSLGKQMMETAPQIPCGVPNPQDEASDPFKPNKASGS